MNPNPDNHNPAVSEQSDFERSFEASIRTPSPSPSSESSTKFFVLIGGLVALLALIAGVTWYLSTTTSLRGSIALKEYKADNFTILVPEDYEKKIAEFGDRIEFKEPGDVSTQSIETVGTLDASSLGDQRDYVISQTDKRLRENKLSEVIDSNLSQETTNYTLEEIEVDGQEARKISAIAVKDGKTIGTIYMMIVYGTDKFYYISVLVHVDDNDLYDSVDKIFSSFKIKQATV